MQNLKFFLSSLPSHPGVYQMLDAKGEVLYVGKAKNLKKRVSSYFSGKAQDAKTMALVEQIDDIDITVTNTETEAVLLECNLIKKYLPPYNILLRDDKSFPYITISIQQDFPRIDSYRGPQKKELLYLGPYPSAAAVRESIQLIQKTFGIRTCRDSYFKARTRPCLLHQIGRCTAPCVNLISKQDYAERVKMATLFLQGKNNEIVASLQEKMQQAASSLDYEKAAAHRDQITRLRQIQDKQYIQLGSGDIDVIGFAMQAGVICIQLLSIRKGQILGGRSYFPKVPNHSDVQEILWAFLSQHYLRSASHIASIPREILVHTNFQDHELLEQVLAELAKHKVSVNKPLKGDKKKWLDMAMNSAEQTLTAQLANKANMQERMQSLQQVLGLDKLPRRLECFDISHSMGEATVASCVVFDQQGSVKSAYRRFNISDITPGDDAAAMQQVINRRFKRLQKDQLTLPDVVFIDGGSIQLNAAANILQQLNIYQVLLVGVSKGPGRKAGFESLHFLNKAAIHLPADSLALHLIQQIRDEAHRFAITGHRQRRDKARRQSILETIPGVGAKRRRELLLYFGGIQGLARASLEELSKVPGINRSLAERIYIALHDANS